MHKVLTSKKFWITAGLFLYISLFFLEKTNLAASDLGRHVTNGKIILHTGSVFHTNLYSYTHPDFPAPNHHWLFGVIAYLIHQAGGFELLTIMGALLYTASIAVVFYFSYRRVGFFPAIAATLLALPLVSDRSETRPEAFSLFFFTVLYILFAWVIEQKKISNVWQLSLTCIAILGLWINIHIFFVLTGVLGISAAIHGYINKLNQFWTWMIALAGSLIAGSFLNPLGLKLILYPLEIFNNYGYRVSENQPLWFFLQHYTRPIHWYLAFFIILFIVVQTLYIRKYWKPRLYFLLVAGFFMLFTLKLIRIENIFAITTIPLMSYAISSIGHTYKKIFQQHSHSTITTMGVSFIAFLLVAIMLGTGLFFPIKASTGIGLYPGYHQSVAFFQSFPFNGPIFNNFDSGSFLIYSLHPSHKVFIDNRAEAYPSDFIQQKYLLAQQDESIWQQLEQEYNFAAIIFYRHEQTNWGQEFMVKRIQDESWAPVYVDNYLIMFLKNNESNQKLIEQYRLPAEMFTVTEN